MCRFLTSFTWRFCQNHSGIANTDCSKPSYSNRVTCNLKVLNCVIELIWSNSSILFIPRSLLLVEDLVTQQLSLLLLDRYGIP